MSKSLARVKSALHAAGIDSQPIEMPGETRTAQQAADAAGCELDQIVKSILFQGSSGRLFLFLTAGGNQVDPELASQLATEPLGRAEINTVRQVTGFAIGGVAPLGHLTPSPTWMDRRLLDFTTVWAAAGTPRHIFPVCPKTLSQASLARIADFSVN
ncbi:YbaK/EbsC family protein [Thioclava sp. FR2]|uniref:YbaK/EbsC family protein n=1 Tax=Thioclava sp. FR2 TaxID=3445780 RepID=UPI003EB6EFC0